MDPRNRSYIFIPPSNVSPAKTTMALLVDTAPEETGIVFVTPVGLEGVVVVPPDPSLLPSPELSPPVLQARHWL